MTLYEELLNDCSEQILDFLKNVPIFENQFKYSDYNEELYKLMYLHNTYLNLKSVKELKEIVPELKNLCKKCGNFYMPQRNKSIPKYDVLLGKQHEDALLKFLHKKTGLKTSRADLENRSLPDCKIMNKDDKTIAYFEVKFHGAPFVSALNLTGRYCYEGSATLDYKKILKQLELIKDLGVPTFYIHWIEYPCLKGIFFETSDQVENYINSQIEIYERLKREGDDLKSKKSIYLKKIYSPLLHMKSFEELIKEIKSLEHE